MDKLIKFFFRNATDICAVCERIATENEAIRLKNKRILEADMLIRKQLKI